MHAWACRVHAIDSGMLHCGIRSLGQYTVDRWLEDLSERYGAVDMALVCAASIRDHTDNQLYPTSPSISH